MNIIKNYFSQEARDRCTLQADNKRLDTLRRLADKAINVTYKESDVSFAITQDIFLELCKAVRSELDERIKSIESQKEQQL